MKEGISQKCAVAEGKPSGVQQADHGLAVCGVGMIVEVHHPEDSLIGVHIPRLGFGSHGDQSCLELQMS